VGLASRGQRDMDDGPADIGDAEIEATVRRQARRVYVLSAIAALVLTGLTVVIPGPG
jgi:hypothetical protein